MNQRHWMRLGLVAGASLFAIGLLVHDARPSDHLDAPATIAEPTADIGDFYAWDDGSSTVLAMTVYPNAPTGAQFSDATQYVFHTTSGAAFSGARSADYVILCQFDTTQNIDCWAENDEHVHGMASSTAGLASSDGKLKVFAGLRSDPFFFNLDGFKKMIADYNAASLSTFNPAGCPTITGGPAAVLQADLSHNPNDGGAPVDTYATFNSLAIVVSVDTTLITSGGPIVAAWASTNQHD